MLKLNFLKASIVTLVSATMLLSSTTVTAKTIPSNTTEIKPSVFTTQENFVPNDLLSNKEDDIIASVTAKTPEKVEHNLISTGNAEENKKEHLKKLKEEKEKKEKEEKAKQEKEAKKQTKTKSIDTSSNASSDTSSSSQEQNNGTSTISSAPQGNALIAISNPDPNYQGVVINLTSYDREVLRHVIMGEAGGEGFAGAALLAQTIRDNWVRGGYSSAESVRVGCGYYGWNSGTNSDVEAAINYIFDQGQNAVQHRVCFMYNPSMCSSAWHESQNYIVTYGPVRYFDAW